MRIERKFTEPGKDPLQGISWESRKSEIRNPDGGIVFIQEGVQVPDFWSQVATDILAQKYFRKTGVPQEDGSLGGESHARQVFERLSKCWRYWGEEEGYFDSSEDAQAFEDEVTYMLAHQMAAPNSPQWFNTGLYHSYGIAGSASGQWRVSSSTGEPEETTTSYENPQAMACFILSVKDSLLGEEGIMGLWGREARIFKFGGGVGGNMSALRGRGESLSGGGKSSGMMSFLRIGDRSAGSIKSGGTTRRAAVMRVLDMDHPDVEDFITWKVSEEYKVATMVAGSRAIRRSVRSIQRAVQGYTGEGGSSVDPGTNRELRIALGKARKEGVPPQWIKRTLDLISQGIFEDMPPEFSTDWEGPSYETVSGQNSNNSLRVPNSFFSCLDSGSLWDLTARSGGGLVRSVSSKDLWDKITHSAWACADPGLQFDTTINEWHTCPEAGRQRSTNPCGEFLWIDDSSCNLASINLVKFLREDGSFDSHAFCHAVHLWTLALDITVGMSSFPSRDIAKNSYDFRTLGLGYANLGALLMRLGLAYESASGRALAGAMTAIMTAEAYLTSSEIAQEKGVFPGFQRSRDSMLRVIRNHRSATLGSGVFEGLTVRPQILNRRDLPAEMKDLATLARNLWEKAVKKGEQHGFRNAQVTLLAPSGTIGLVMDCDTTGIEPDYALVKYKKLAGGGYFKIVNQSVPLALRKLGYTPAEVQGIVHYVVGHSYPGCMDNRECPINSSTLNGGRGFKEVQLRAIEDALPGSFNIHAAFAPHLLGEKFCRDVLGISESQLGDPSFRVLEFLGFSKEAIEEADLYYCGAMTVEGSPHVKEEHYPVFSCANRCGKVGEQVIPYEAHITMMASVQPFLSGAISKTVNMPEESTIEDVGKVYRMAWEKMIKCIALYRDGAKLSQPLSSSLSDWLWEDSEEDATPIKKVEQAVLKVTEMWSARRRALPDKRRGYTQKANVGGHKVYLRTGEYEDGKIGEIFLDMHKEGAAIRSWMNSFAIAISLGLQYGVPLQEFVDAFTFTKFEPNGIVQQHDHIKMATSVIDYVFRDLALNYLGRDDLVHVPMGKDFQDTKVLNPKGDSVYDLKREERKLQGFTGDLCPDCGSTMMTRNGTCLKCQSCGATTGCS